MQHEHTHPEFAECLVVENGYSLRNTSVIEIGQVFKVHLRALRLQRPRANLILKGRETWPRTAKV